MASRIVALSGSAGSGKSEVAKHLVKKHGFELVKFASPLKDMLRAFYMTQGIVKREDIERRIEGDLKERPDPMLMWETPRYAMQTLGTEWGRDCIGVDFWLNAWLRRVNAIEGPVVVDDCRFDNEADLVRGQGGQVFLIKPRTKRRKRSVHTSEIGIDTAYIDFTVENNGTIEELNACIDGLLFDKE